MSGKLKTLAESNAEKVVILAQREAHWINKNRIFQSSFSFEQKSTDPVEDAKIRLWEMKEIVQISGSHLKSLMFSLYLKFAEMDENPSMRGEVKISWWGKVTMDSKLKNCGENIEPWGNLVENATGGFLSTKTSRGLTPLYVITGPLDKQSW